MFDNVTINTPQETSELNSLGDCPFEPDFVPTSCFGVGFNAPTVDIKVKVKKKYEGLFKEIKVALEILDKIRFSVDGTCYSCCNLHHDLLNSLDLDNNCINYNMFINRLFTERGIQEAELLNAINSAKMSGKLREKYKSVLNCHESSKSIFGKHFDLISAVDYISVCERKDTIFLTISVLTGFTSRGGMIAGGLLIETFGEKIVNICLGEYGDDINTYRTEEDKWNNKLIIDFTEEDEDKQLIIPLLDLNKIYNVKLRAVFKEDRQKNMGAVLEVFKFAVSKKDISTDCRLGETIRTFSMNYDMVLYHTIDVVYDSYPVDVDEFTADDMADINKILAGKGYGKLLTNEEYYDELKFRLDFNGNIEYVSEELSEKQWELEINVHGDLITKIIDSFEKMRHNTIELSCIVDGKEVLQ